MEKMRQVNSPAPLISIITVCYQSAATIQETIDSVSQQSFRNFEHIVVDGRSTDGTVEILKANEEKLAACISESDDGIADAMNKGIRLAKGTYIFFLQSDDYFVADNSLAYAAKKLAIENHDISAFPVVFLSSGKTRVLKPEPFSVKSYFKCVARHQGLFISRTVFDRVGLFNSAYKITMDLEHLLRAREAGVKITIFDQAVAVMRDGGISSRQDWHGIRQRLAEERAAHLSHISNRVIKLLYRIFSAVYFPYKKFRSW